MKNEIEMIADEYIVQSSIEIGDYRYIFARHKDENEKHPYHHLESMIWMSLMQEYCKDI